MKRLLFFGAVVAVGFAGCGGGGSSSTPAAAPPLGPASIPASVQRSDVQVALTTVQASTLLSQFGATAGGTSAAPLNARRTVLRTLRDMHARRTIEAASACSNSTTADFTSTGASSGNLIETLYFDTACTQKREVIAVTVDGTADTVAGTLTTYDRSGTVTTADNLHAALTISAGVDVVSVSVTPVAGANGTAVDLTCTVDTAATNITCGAAGTATLADSSMVGSSLAFTGSAANFPTGNTITFSASANAYTGGPGALSLASGAGDAWNVVGGTLVAADSVSDSITSATSGQVTAINLTVHDSTYADSVTLGESTAGFSLTEVLGTTTLATGTLDLSGNGVITYADGSQTTVRNYTIVAS